MKRVAFLSLIMTLIIINFACMDEPDAEENLTDCRSYYKVVNDTSILNPNKLHRPYRIHIQDNYFFVADLGYGIRIFDFSNLKSFHQVAIIELPGNTTFTVDGNYLYADNCNNIMVFDISNPKKPEFIDMTEDVFFEWPDRIYVYEDGDTAAYSEENGLMSNFYNDYYEVPQYFYGACSYQMPDAVPIDQYYEENYEDYLWYPESSVSESYDDYWLLDGGITPAAPSFENSYSGNEGGSMASMVMIGSYLYAIDIEGNAKIMNVEEPSDITVANVIDLENLETIYPFGQYAFFGGMNGMYIYDITDPLNPDYVSAFTHVTVCDPVVVSGNYAYVTLRSDNDGSCGQTVDFNALEIIDISDIYNPTLVSQYLELNGPYGLGTDQDIVWVCDGGSGIDVIDVSDKENPVSVGSISDLDAFDLILYYEMIFISGQSGIYLYDYSQDILNPELLATLEITDADTETENPE